MTASQPSSARRTAAGSSRSPTIVAAPYGEGTRSKTRGSCPCAERRSTTCEPMKPDPPVTSTLITTVDPGALMREQSERSRRSVPTMSDPRGFSFGGRSVVERNAPVVLRDPVRVRKLDVVAEQAVARLVVDLARRALDRVENDVLVVARRHPRRQDDAVRVDGVELLTGLRVLPRDDLVQPLHLDDADRSRELVHAEVEPVNGVVGLAVV